MARVLVEKKLAKMHNRAHCIFVSRGTTALYLALRTIKKRGNFVVVPAVVCMSVVNAILYAGFRPLFCDVLKSTYTLDPVALNTLLQTSVDIKAILMVHIYGNATEAVAIQALARKHRIPLIEDAAQALGGILKGQRLGSFGDISILSFGQSKIIDIGEGGALLFDDPSLVKKIQKEYCVLPSLKASSAKKYSTLYRNAYYTLAALTRQHPSLSYLYSSFPDIFRDLYLYRKKFPEIFYTKLIKKLSTLEKEIEERRKRAVLYKNLLVHPLIVHPSVVEGAYWRYSFLVRGSHQYQIATQLRKQGIDVSNWYPAAHRFFELHPPHLSNAEYIEDHIFNLWTDSSVPLDRIRTICKRFIKILQRYG